MIVTYAAPDGRHVVVADANPGIFGLPTATLRPLEDMAREPEPAAAPAAGPADATAAVPDGSPAAGPDGSPAAGPAGPSSPEPSQEVSWRDEQGESLLPPNLGPPPERLDWRRRPDDDR
jgi:hypothetical protein